MGSAYKPYWIKLWVEILEDPKVQTMPDRLWRRMAELFLIAGKHNQDGVLPPVIEMAWVLRLDPGELIKDLKQLAKIGGKGREIVVKESGGWILKNYEKRQSATPAKQRMEEYRKRIKDGAVTPQLRGSYDNVTDKSPETETETETKAETETETDNTPLLDLGFPVGSFPNINILQRETIIGLVSEHGFKKVEQCFMWAAKKGMTHGEAILAAETALPNWTEGLKPKLVTDEQRLRYFTKYYSKDGEING